MRSTEGISMRKRLLLSGILIAATLLAQGPAPNQPVYVLLYSRYFDHFHDRINAERIRRLVPLVEQYRSSYPQSDMSVLVEFSGSMTDVFTEHEAEGLATGVKEAARKGLIELGYTGEEEPSYLYRPRPDVQENDPPEKRWVEQESAAERFLTAYKDPATGRPTNPDKSGGLRRVQEVFGPAAYIRGVSGLIVGDSPVSHAVRKLNSTAMMRGVPANDPRRGISGYTASVEDYSQSISPEPSTSPEVFWQDNFLRLSDLSTPDNQPHSTDDMPEAIQKAFNAMSRSKVRVVALEIDSYKRYFAKRADGTVIWDPMEWGYYHPDDTEMPTTLHAIVKAPELRDRYEREDAILKWLLTDFFPNHPGSRFVSVRDLQQMAGPVLPPTVSAAEIREIAGNIDSNFKAMPQKPSDFIKAGGKYFTDAEAFQILAEALVQAVKTGSLPAAVKPVPMNGLIAISQEQGPFKGTVTVGEITDAVAQILPALHNSQWKPLPDNILQPMMQVGSQKLNASQVLHLMSWAIVDPRPERVLTLSPLDLMTDLAWRYPKNTPASDQGVGWTLKPAILRIPPSQAAK
jgi:hypothetical protein